jgi:hypothetical protein
VENYLRHCTPQTECGDLEEETWHAVHEGDTVGGLENASNLMIANLENEVPAICAGRTRVHRDTRPSATPIQENSYHDGIINCPVPIQLGAGAPHISLEMLYSTPIPVALSQTRVQSELALLNTNVHVFPPRRPRPAQYAEKPKGKENKTRRRSVSLHNTRYLSPETEIRLALVPHRPKIFKTIVEPNPTP